MMNGLRHKSGIDQDFFAIRTGLSPDGVEPIIAQLQQEGFLKNYRSNYCTTDLGARFLDNILQRFS